MKLKRGDIVWKWIDRKCANAQTNLGRYGVMRYEIQDIVDGYLLVKNTLGHEKTIDYPVYETEYLCKLGLGNYLTRCIDDNQEKLLQSQKDYIKFLKDYIDE